VLDADAMLADQIRDPEAIFDRDELNLTEREWLRTTLVIPASVVLFGPPPPGRDRKNETPSPTTNVVTDVNDDFGSASLWCGRIANHVGDTHRLASLPPTA
jgi:hypothetical protein